MKLRGLLAQITPHGIFDSEIKIAPDGTVVSGGLEILAENSNIDLARVSAVIYYKKQDFLSIYLLDPFIFPGIHDEFLNLLDSQEGKNHIVKIFYSVLGRAPMAQEIRSRGSIYRKFPMKLFTGHLYSLHLIAIALHW